MSRRAWFKLGGWIVCVMPAIGVVVAIPGDNEWGLAIVLGLMTGWVGPVLGEMAYEATL